MSKLIILRHGNTFDSGDEILRVGCRTDLSLSSSGKKQAYELSKIFPFDSFNIKRVFTSNLKRTKETAAILLQQQEPVLITPLKEFDEIDYGELDGAPERIAVEKLGNKLTLWEEKAIMPDSWNPNAEIILNNWKKFMSSISTTDEDTLVVTSNGIARFAMMHARNFHDFIKNNTFKLKTCKYGIIELRNDGWYILEWNQ